MSAFFRYRPILVLLVATLVYVLAVVQRMSPPVVALEIMNDLVMDPDSLSLMFAVTMICYGAMQPVAGFWADRFGPRRCLLVAALSLALASVAFSLAQGLYMGLAARAVVGLAAGVALMPCLKLGSHWFSPRQFGLLSSAVVASAALGNFIVGRPLASFSSEFGWRWSFAGLGLIGLLLGLLVFLVVRDRPSLPVEGAAQDGPAPEAAGHQRRSFLKTLGLMVREPEFWLLGFLYACTDLIFAVFTGLWAGPFLMEVYALSEVTVGNMLSIAALGFLVGPTLWTLLANAWNSYARVLVLIAGLNVLIALMLVRGPGELSRGALYALCFIAPVGAQVAGMIFVLARGLFPDDMAASAMGLINIFAIVPGALMQKLIGGILARGEMLEPALSARELYSQAFMPLLICMILGVPLALWQLRREKRLKGSWNLFEKK